MAKNFRIDWVVEQDLPDYPKKRTATGFKMECPFCHKKDKFDINVSKGLANCIPCGKGFNALTLHATLCNVDNKTAYKDLWKRYNGLSSELKAQIDKPLPPIENTVEPLWVRSLIYREFLNNLTLKEEHKQKLMARGLSEQQIIDFGYKSVPEEEIDCTGMLKDICIYNSSEVRRYLNNRWKLDIAGFEWRNNHFIATKRKSGILIPIIIKYPHERIDVLRQNVFNSESDLISGFQIRYDEGDKRYSYYAGEGQFAGYENIHMRLPEDEIEIDADGDYWYVQPELPTVVITEGGLKADIASALSNNTPFIAVMGVNNQKWLASTLRVLKNRYHTKEVVFAFDMDMLDNQHVKDALEQAKSTASSIGLEVRDCKPWTEEYRQHGIKGIDDLLLFRKNLMRKDNSK